MYPAEINLYATRDKYNSCSTIVHYFKDVNFTIIFQKYYKHSKDVI